VITIDPRCCVFRNGTDKHKREEFAWDRRCVGIEATAALSQLVATAGSQPRIARLDLAAMVLSRRKLATENVQFGTSFCFHTYWYYRPDAHTAV
jgi:hypothetical protein